MKIKVNEVLSLIKERRSIREFATMPIPRDVLASILEAGRWAPSGLNNQPWRFVVVEDDGRKTSLAAMTKYSSILLLAPTAIAVFLDQNKSYSREKDLMGIGACIQNMLLQAYSLGVGTCWLGEILNKADAVEDMLGVPDTYELMAVIAMGYPDSEKTRANSNRMTLKELLFGTWPFD